MRTKKVSVHIPEDDYEILERLANGQHRPVANLIVAMLRDQLHQQSEYSHKP